jgi:RHS repeat-associated protein
VLERYIYDPYGSPTVLNPDWSLDADGTDFSFVYLHQGGRHDSTLKLSHFRNRDLHVELGRWTRQDPLGFVDGSNVYQAYVSSPVNGVDPSGLARIPVPGTGLTIVTEGTPGSIGHDHIHVLDKNGRRIATEGIDGSKHDGKVLDDDLSRRIAERVREALRKKLDAERVLDTTTLLPEASPILLPAIDPNLPPVTIEIPGLDPLGPLPIPTPSLPMPLPTTPVLPNSPPANPNGTLPSPWPSPSPEAIDKIIDTTIKGAVIIVGIIGAAAAIVTGVAHG